MGKRTISKEDFETVDDPGDRRDAEEDEEENEGSEFDEEVSGEE